jgi:hypothetical protein
VHTLTAPTLTKCGPASRSRLSSARISTGVGVFAYEATGPDEHFFVFRRGLPGFAAAASTSPSADASRTREGFGGPESAVRSITEVSAGIVSRSKMGEHAVDAPASFT